jgi:hypothetical protein
MQFFERFMGEYEMNVAEEVRRRVMDMGKSEVEDDQTIEALKKGFQFQTVEVDWDKLVALPDYTEKQVRRSGPWGVEHVTIPVYSFELPYEGDARLFGFHGGNHRLWSFEADVHDGKIHFEIQGADKAKLDSIKSNFSFDLEHLLKDVPRINGAVTNAADNARNERLKRLESSQDGLSAFGVPVKGAE